MAPFFLLFAVLYAVRHWWLIKTGMPRLGTAVTALVVSSLIMAVPWVVLAMFFDHHRFKLPGDGNWPAISAMAGLGACHLWLLLMLPKPVSLTQATGSTDTSTGNISQR